MKKNRNAWTLLGTLVLLIPVILVFGAVLKDVDIEPIHINLAPALRVVGILLIAGVAFYSLLRVVLAIACNKFIPKIPMPKSVIGKIIVLAAAGIIIGVFSPIWLLAAWIGVCLLSTFTYSFA